MFRRGTAADARAAADQLYVEPTMTGRGIGAGFLKLAKGERPEGLRLWTFASNTGAQRFYERHGFLATRRTDGRENEEGAPDILYVCVIIDGPPPKPRPVQQDSGQFGRAAGPRRHRS